MLIWALWLTIVFGGGFLGVGAAWTLISAGGSLVLAVNAAVYLGCALVVLPKLLRLVRGVVKP